MRFPRLFAGLWLAGAVQAMITNIACSTAYGTVSRKTTSRTTDTFTFTRTVTHLSTTIPTKTITPAVSTSTVTSSTTSTIIVDYVSTDTYTTTQTTTTTGTSTETDSYTATDTTTTTTTTSTTYTVPTPAGFTPLAIEPGFAPRGRSVQERDTSFVGRGEVAVAAPKINTAGKVATTSKAQYPKAVTCDEFITTFATRVSIETAATSATTTLAAVTTIVTATVSTSTTATSTMADATSFVTMQASATTTVTTTTSTTTTETATQTVVLPTATAYAQCAPNNIMDSAQGQDIGYIAYNPAFTLASTYTSDTTGLGCCDVCATIAGCAGYAQAPNSGACYYILTDGRCAPTSSFGDVYHYYEVNGGGYTIGNGQCGFLAGVAGT